MKMPFLIPLLFVSYGSQIFGQQKQVRLTLKEFQSNHYQDLKPSVDSAISIANALLNSQEFRDSILKYDFTCRNYGSFCNHYCDNCEGRITGKTVLDSLYQHGNGALTLILNRCNYEYGHSSKNIEIITSCYKKIRNDELSLPFSYCYAYHIAHEYMHIVGFFHTDHVDDVAEKTGWIGYYILKRWYQEKTPIEY